VFQYNSKNKKLAAETVR